MQISFEKFIIYTIFTNGWYLIFYLYRVWSYWKDNPLENFERDTNNNSIIRSFMYPFFLFSLAKRVNVFSRNLSLVPEKEKNFMVLSFLLTILIITPFFIILPLIFQGPLIPNYDLYMNFIKSVGVLLILTGTIYLFKNFVIALNKYYKKQEEGMIKVKRTLHTWEYIFVLLGSFEILYRLIILIK